MDIEVINEDDMRIEPAKMAVEPVKKAVPAKKEDESSALIRLAIEHGVDTERLEKLIDLRNKEQDRQAKIAYDKAFAKMQAQLPKISRSKTAEGKSGEEMYNYAPLDALMGKAQPIISKYGFSYSWSEKTIEGGGKRVILTITGHGHSRETTFDVPLIQGTQRMNPIQVMGAMSTYGRRYTFVAGFGIVIEEEDDDAVSLSNIPPVYQDHIYKIEEASTMDELRDAFTEGYTKSKGDNKALLAITKAKDKRKKEIEHGTKN